MIDDLGSDYDDTVYIHPGLDGNRNHESSDYFCSEDCNIIQQICMEDSLQKEDFQWGDTTMKLQ